MDRGRTRTQGRGFFWPPGIRALSYRVVNLVFAVRLVRYYSQRMAARSYDRKEFRTTPKFLATIDFGTTHCSVAYLLRPDLASPSKIDPTVLKLDNAGNRRVPSCILFDSNGNMIAFGQEARQRFTALKRDQRPGHHYFEYVKKHLQHEEVTRLMWWMVGRA